MTDNNINNKKLYGQFFTSVNPFKLDIFYRWMKLIPNVENVKILEPFAGANNIVKMIMDLGFKNEWECYDIKPSDYNAVPECPIIEKDTILNFPKGFSVAITNPPYLAKNSATRNKLEFPTTKYDDLYKVALDTMLNNLGYVAAIIPESFISAEIFQERIYAFISLTCKMFDETDCPVCLALFIPSEQKAKVGLKINDFFVYIQNKKIGKYNSLYSKKPSSSLRIDWKFNDKDGIIGIKCIDGLKEASIRFVNGNEINKDAIKVSSRSLTRVSGLPDDIDLNVFLDRCNQKLEKCREDTFDIFLTSFKGLRKDGRYRRRLDFKNARDIMNSAVEEIRRKKPNGQSHH